MTYDQIIDYELRGILRRKHVALVLKLRTDGQNFRFKSATTLRKIHLIGAGFPKTSQMLK